MRKRSEQNAAATMENKVIQKEERKRYVRYECSGCGARSGTFLADNEFIKLRCNAVKKDGFGRCGAYLIEQTRFYL
jgi:hypothetical protein